MSKATKKNPNEPNNPRVDVNDVLYPTLSNLLESVPVIARAETLRHYAALGLFAEKAVNNFDTTALAKSIDALTQQLAKSIAEAKAPEETQVITESTTFSNSNDVSMEKNKPSDDQAISQNLKMERASKEPMLNNPNTQTETNGIDKTEDPLTKKLNESAIQPNEGFIQNASKLTQQDNNLVSVQATEAAIDSVASKINELNNNNSIRNNIADKVPQAPLSNVDIIDRFSNPFTGQQPTPATPKDTEKPHNQSDKVTQQELLHTTGQIGNTTGTASTATQETLVSHKNNLSATANDLSSLQTSPRNDNNNVDKSENGTTSSTTQRASSETPVKPYQSPILRESTSTLDIKNEEFLTTRPIEAAPEGQSDSQKTFATEHTVSNNQQRQPVPKTEIDED